MEFVKKYIIPALVLAGCLIPIGNWISTQSNFPEANDRSEAVGHTDVQLPEVEKFEPGVATLDMVTEAPDTPLQTPTLRSGYEASGTLNDQVERALAAKDGLAAANLAFILKECEMNQGILELASSEGTNPRADPELIAKRLERLRQYEREFAACQTVPGDHKQVRLRLLHIAIQQGVIGAATEAFLAGSREPSTLSQVVRDANAGDRFSLVDVAMHDPKLFGVTRDEQDAARYALKLASTDPEVGSRVINSLKIAEGYAVPNSHFDLSEISGAARTKGAEISERLKKRLRKESS